MGSEEIVCQCSHNSYIFLFSHAHSKNQLNQTTKAHGILPFSCCLCFCAEHLIEIEWQCDSSAASLPEYRAAGVFVQEFPFLHFFTPATGQNTGLAEPRRLSRHYVETIVRVLLQIQVSQNCIMHTQVQSRAGSPGYDSLSVLNHCAACRLREVSLFLPLAIPPSLCYQDGDGGWGGEAVQFPCGNHHCCFRWLASPKNGNCSFLFPCCCCRMDGRPAGWPRWMDGPSR